MAEIRHLENRQIAISQRQIIQFWWHLVHNGTLGTRWQCVTEYDFYNSRCRTVAILKIVIFGHTSAADCPISVKFCAGKQFFISISNGTDIRVRQNVFFVFLMQLGLRRAAAFVSHPIHLLLIYYTLFFLRRIQWYTFVIIFIVIIMLYWTVRQNATAYIEPIGVKSYNNTQ